MAADEQLETRINKGTIRGGVMVDSDKTKEQLIDELQELRVSEQLYRTSFERSAACMGRAGLDGILLDANETFCRWLGYERDELIGKRMHDITHPDDLNISVTQLGSMRQPGSRFVMEKRYMRRDGIAVWACLHGATICDATGTPSYIDFVIQDITELKRAMEAMGESERRYRSFVKNFRGIAYRGRMDFTPVFFHGAVEEITGYTEEEFCAGKPRWDQVVHPEDLPLLFSAGEAHLHRTPNYSYDREYRIVRKDGSVRWLHEVIQNVCDDSDEPTAVQGTIYDITERKCNEEEKAALEAKLIQTQKMEALGTLAGGIAHDFNNLLTGILGNVELAMLDLSPVSPARGSLVHIQTTCIRAADLCRQLLAYSGRGCFVIESLDVNEIIREMAHLLNISVSKRVMLNYQLYPDLPAVEADPTQLRQVVMNIITNASEAIQERSGLVTISTGAIECDKSYLHKTFGAANLSPGLYVHIEVTDTGCGMDAETQKRIFDPFFTTKSSGRGLGLAAVLGILHSHKGALRIYSTPRHGTTFKVLLPASDAPVPYERPQEQSEDTWHGTGTALVVDDDETVRVVACKMLKRAGFEVITAVDGREALALIHEYEDAITVLVLDFIMPVMDGGEVLRHLQSEQRKLPVVMASGYSEEMLVQRFTNEGVVTFIHKPFQYQTLITKVREVIERCSASTE